MFRIVVRSFKICVRSFRILSDLSDYQPSNLGVFSPPGDLSDYQPRNLEFVLRVFCDFGDFGILGCF